MEKYEDPKFKVVFLGKRVPKTKEVQELIRWFRKFYDIGLAPEYGSGSSGNLSFRHKNGLIIKSTQSYFGTIKAEDLVFVEKFDLDRKIAYVYGANEPSTETQMHYLIYKNRKDINAVFHLHDYSIMEKAERLGIPITKVTEAGTPAIGYDVLGVIDEKRIVVMREHGIVAVGRDMEEVGDIILKYRKLII